MIVSCIACMQAQSGAAVDGLHAAVITLVAVTACVLVVFGRFVIRVGKRQ